MIQNTLLAIWAGLVGGRVRLVIGAAEWPEADKDTEAGYNWREKLCSKILIQLSDTLLYRFVWSAWSFWPENPEVGCNSRRRWGEKGKPTPPNSKSTGTVLISLYYLLISEVPNWLTSLLWIHSLHAARQNVEVSIIRWRMMGRLHRLNIFVPVNPLISGVPR